MAKFKDELKAPKVSRKAARIIDTFQRAASTDGYQSDQGSSEDAEESQAALVKAGRVLYDYVAQLERKVKAAGLKP